MSDWTDLRARKSDYDTAVLRVEAASELLDEAVAEREHIRAELVDLIRVEVRSGATWEEIGAQLDVSASVARELTT